MKPTKRQGAESAPRYIVNMRLHDGGWIVLFGKSAWDTLSTVEKWLSIEQSFKQQRDCKEGTKLLKLLLREDGEPIPLEGKRLLAELFDPRAPKRERLPGVFRIHEDDIAEKHVKRKRREFDEIAKVVDEMDRTGCSKNAAAKKICPGRETQVAKKIKTPMRGGLPRGKPVLKSDKMA